MAKVTFGKVEKGMFAGDDTSREVLLDGELVGEIVGSHADIGGTYNEYRLDCYMFNSYTEGIEDFSIDFDPKAGVSRQALANIKAQIRAAFKG